MKRHEFPEKVKVLELEVQKFYEQVSNDESDNEEAVRALQHIRMVCDVLWRFINQHSIPKPEMCKKVTDKDLKRLREEKKDETVC